MANTLVVRLAEDAWNGDAQFTLDVDGVQIAGPTSVTTKEGSGYQEFTYTGDYGAGPHTVAVNFINDAWGGTPDTDRNLYVNGIVFDGTFYSAQNAPDTGAGADTDPNAAEVLSNGTVTFGNVINGSSPPPPPAGSDTLVLHLSEDAFNGDAQFALFVDGAQIAGPVSVTTAHGSGFQDFTYTGNFGSGPHTVDIRFLNDAWGGTASTDRNMYVGGITFDGTSYAGETAQNTASNGGPDTDPNAAEMRVNGDVIFSNVTGSGSGGTTGTHIVGTANADTLTGGDGNDTIEGLGGGDSIAGGGGNDIIDGGTGLDQLTGGAGADTFLVHATDSTSSDVVWDFAAGSGAGHDAAQLDGFTYTSTADVLANLFQSGADVHLALDRGQSVTFAGHSVADFTAADFVLTNSIARPAGQTLTGTAGGETIEGGDWNDSISGAGGDDFLRGSYGNDSINGGDGNDTLVGGVTLFPNVDDGRDTLDGGAGNDILYGGPLATFMIHAGNGSDSINNYVLGTGPRAQVVLDGYALGSMDDVRAHTTTDAANGVTTIDLLNGETLTFREGVGLPHGAAPVSVDDINFAFTNVTTGGGGGGAGGSDTLVLHVSEDAWNGDAQFLLFVDGVQQGAARTVTTHHGTGIQDITVTGSFGAGPHSVDIRFINDAWGGSPDTDRNMYVHGITFDGVNYAGQTAQDTAMNGAPETDPNAAEMFVNGDVTFTNVTASGTGGGTTPPPSGVTSTVVIHASEDAWNGDAQFLVFINGVQQGGAQTVTASHAAAQSQSFTFTGDFGPLGPSTVAVQFINDAWGGTASTDRNLYVSSIDVNGANFLGGTANPSATEMDINSTATFTLITYGDTSGNISNFDHAAAQNLGGNAIIVGDANGFFGHAIGGNDTIDATGAGDTYAVGDAITITDDAHGGNDSVSAGGNISRAFAYGDALTLSGNAIGGDDTVSAGARSDGTAYGDARVISGFAQGGDDHVSSGSRFGSISYGDAQTITDHGRGGDDFVTGDTSASPVLPLLYGDAQTLSGFAIGGNDTISGGLHGAEMYGDGHDLLDNAIGGNDLLTSSSGSDLMWGDAAVVAATAQTGNDIFLFNRTAFTQLGNDTIEDFQPGKDHIELQNYSGITSFSDLSSHISDTSNGALITFDSANTILVANDHNLTADDFIFG